LSTHENIFELGSDNAVFVRPLDVYDHYASIIYIRTKYSCVLCVRVNTIIFLFCSTWLEPCRNFTLGLL